MALEPEIDNFFAHWVEEFARSVEMFTGDAPVLTLLPLATAEMEASRLAGFLWWKQPVEGEGSFACWTGAPVESWSALGGAVDENNKRGMYLDILDNANKGAAAALSARFPHPLRCTASLEDDLSSLATLDAMEVKLVFRGQPLPSLLVAIEPSAAQVMRLSEEAPAAPPAASAAPQKDPDPAAGVARLSPDQTTLQSLMLNRLMELRLPVSVLLGHANISIREILKLTSGSVIELDRKVGDYVEIVVHGTVVARGEIVSIGGNYGVRIKEVISREDRLALRRAA